MFKRIAGTALVASMALNLSAKENKEDHVLNFEQVKLQSSGRNARHLVSTALEPTETFAYTYGKAKLAEGKSGQAIDFSDNRTRTEFRVRTGKFYNHNGGSMSFWISPTKKQFGTKAAESAIFEENNGDTLYGLYIDDRGRLKIKVSSRFPLDKTKSGKTADQYTDDDFKKKAAAIDKRDDVQKSIDADRDAKDAAKKAIEDAKKPQFQVKEFSFSSFQVGDTTNWKEGEWNKITVSWDLSKGFFAVYVNGKFAIRSFAHIGRKQGMYLNRVKPGKFITFGVGNTGLSAKIDDLRISKAIVDGEFEVEKK